MVVVYDLVKAKNPYLFKLENVAVVRPIFKVK